MAVYPRTRLFARLDDAIKWPVVWVQGPAGAGKTTLVCDWLSHRKRPHVWYQVDPGDADIASFFYYMGQASAHAAPRRKKPLPLFTPEYLHAAPVFTRRYFEEFFQRLRVGSVVVFDNYQDVPLDSAFHELISHALETIPEGINVVILSRGEPPPQLSRLHANKALGIIGWDDLRFRLNESGELLALQGCKDISNETLNVVQAKTEGWAAGLILLTAQSVDNKVVLHDIERVASGEIFHYFASQIFDKADDLTQRFLVTVAFMPSVTSAMAAELTNVDDAGSILEQLVRNHYFTQKHVLHEPSYQFHALFRTFLLERARSYFSPEELLSIRRKAGALLSTAGQTEAAAELLVEAGDWAALTNVILAEAQALTLQGRSKTLDNWIRAIPEQLRNGNAWVLYWAGICRMASSPDESRAVLEESFALFRRDDNAAGAYLSWAAIIDTFNFEWGDFSPLDRWIAELEELQKAYPAIPSSKIGERVAGGMLSAIANRQPTHPDASKWSERVLQVALTSNNVPVGMISQLVFYYSWIREFSTCSVLIDALESSRRFKEYDALSELNWYVMEATYAVFVANWPRCTRAVESGLKLADESGIHVFDLYLLATGISGAICFGDPTTTSAWFEKAMLINSPRVGDKAAYHYLAASVAWYRGELEKSIEHSRVAIRIGETIGWRVKTTLCHLELAITLFDKGDYAAADVSLATARHIGEGMTGLQFHIDLQAGRFAFQQDKKSEGLAFLQSALSAGARNGFLNSPRWNDTSMARLCAIALEHGIEPDYVRRLIKVRNLIPPKSVGLNLESWPWPVKIFTLGKFKIMRDDESLGLSGKTQQKPLALLKALVAFGGKDVPEKRLMDSLWPEADGDRARHSLKINLHRLRKFFENEEIVTTKKGLYTIDASRVWIDARYFESVLNETELAIDECRVEAVSPMAECLLSLHSGAFLEMEPAPWALTARERLRLRFSRTVARAANLLLKSNPAGAIRMFEKALDADPLVQAYYEGMMRAYKNLDRPTEALAVYHRCAEVLRRELDLSPSATIEDLRRAILPQ